MDGIIEDKSNDAAAAAADDDDKEGLALHCRL
jgi:hypothetical protein